MVLDKVVERFVKHTPVTVMARLTLQRAMEPAWIDTVFEEHRQSQYTRELLFSTAVGLMSVVVTGLRPSLHAAAKACPELPVSVTALYDKVNHTDPEVVRALVQGSAHRLEPVVQPMLEGRAPTLPGYRVRILDGNHLPASEKRLSVLRGFRGAALPGQSLVVYDPDTDLVTDLILAEDAHAQERSLMEPVLEASEPGDLWMADRNFCTRPILLGWHCRKSLFIVREHGRNPNPQVLGPWGECGRIETGAVQEQRVALQDDAGNRIELRRIELHLDTPTEDGETVIRLLTNLPDTISALTIARLYRRRWRIENLFQRLESALHSEIASLGHPRAALLGFGVAVLAYNALAVLQAAVTVQHHLDETREIEVSSYYVATEIKANYGGMMIAVRAAAWQAYDALTAPELAQTLLDLAAHADLRALRKHPRGPKVPKKKGYVPANVARRHVSTARVIHEGRIV